MVQVPDSAHLYPVTRAQPELINMGFVVLSFGAFFNQEEITVCGSRTIS
ncbi:hypothetical protein [Thermosporothrix hazakensis]|nr:hypothetical protein [Thermosporothrix hazakensis]